MPGLGNWITRHRLWAHLLIPAALSLLLMGLYFSGSSMAQAIVSPKVEGLAFLSWREFGALEMLQNVVLILIAVCLARSVGLTQWRWQKPLFALMTLLVVFLLLEETDYGLHFYEYFTGSTVESETGEWNRNLHNLEAREGVQWTGYLKDLAKGILVLGFVAAPLVFRKSENTFIRLFTPSRWCIATVLLLVLLSRLAHFLEGAGLSVIDGQPGSLEHNISEFRELNMYYLGLLYFAELSDRLKKGRVPPRDGGSNV